MLKYDPNTQAAQEWLLDALDDWRKKYDPEVKAQMEEERWLRRSQEVVAHFKEWAASNEAKQSETPAKDIAFGDDTDLPF